MTENEKIAALKRGGWEEVKPGQWRNSVAFDYKDQNDPGRGDNGVINRDPKTQQVIGRVKVVPEGVTRTLDAAYEIEAKRGAK